MWCLIVSIPDDKSFCQIHQFLGGTEIDPDVVKLCRLSLFLKDPFFQIILKKRSIVNQTNGLYIGSTPILMIQLVHQVTNRSQTTDRSHTTEQPTALGGRDTEQ